MHTHTCRHAHCRYRDGPHMAFSSQAVAFWSPAQCALPLIVVAAAALHLFATQLHFWQRMCGSLFCPYHRQGSFPRPALTLEWSVTCRLSTWWPHHTPGSFTFGSYFPNELKRPIVQLRGRPQLPLPSICTSGPILQWLVSAGSAWFSFDHVLARSQLCQQGAHWEENICHI